MAVCTIETSYEVAASILVRYKSGHFGKPLLALSCDAGTGRIHRDSAALFRCKSGTGPSPGITSASPGIVLVIASLDYIIDHVLHVAQQRRRARGLWRVHGFM